MGIGISVRSRSSCWWDVGCDGCEGTNGSGASGDGRSAVVVATACMDNRINGISFSVLYTILLAYGCAKNVYLSFGMLFTG